MKNKMNKTKGREEKIVWSNCCRAGAVVRTGEEGTSHYECKSCGKPCDLVKWKDFVSNQTITNHEPKEVRESWEEWKANSAEELSRYLHVALNGRIYMYPSPAEDYSEWGNENHRESFVQLVDGLVAKIRHQAIQETVEKIRTIVIKQRGIGSMTTKGVTDYISRPKLLQELKSITNSKSEK